MDEQKIKQNIVIITKLLIFCMVLLCIFIPIEIFIEINNVNKKEEIEESSTLGEISLDDGKEEIINYPLENNNLKGQLVGNEYLNLIQSDIFFDPQNVCFLTGNNDYIVYELDNNLMIYYLQDKKEEILIKNFNVKCLNIIDNFIIGVKINNMNNTIFIYNVNNNSLMEYGTNENQKIISLAIDGCQIYYLDARTANIYSMDFNGNNRKAIGNFENHFIEPVYILGIQDNNMVLKALKSYGILDIRTNEMNWYDMDNILPDMVFQEKKLSIKYDNKYYIYLNDKEIFSGNLTSINLNENHIYISENNILYEYDGANLKKIKELNETINNIYTINDKYIAILMNDKLVLLDS